MLVYLYPSYWMSFYFLYFLQQIVFFRFWESGGGHIQSWLWCFLSAVGQKFLCAWFCVLGAAAGGAIPTEQCHQGTGLHHSTSVCSRTSSASVLHHIGVLPPGWPTFSRDTVAAASCGYRLSQNRGESVPENNVSGKICMPVPTPACTQARWGCGSRLLLHFFLLLKIGAAVTVITCSNSGNGFLFLKHQRPQLTMSCSEMWSMRHTPHVAAVDLGCCKWLCAALCAPSVSCFRSELWCSGEADSETKSSLPVIGISVAHASFWIHDFFDQWGEHHVGDD